MELSRYIFKNKFSVKTRPFSRGSFVKCLSHTVRNIQKYTSIKNFICSRLGAPVTRTTTKKFTKVEEMANTSLVTTPSYVSFPFPLSIFDRFYPADSFLRQGFLFSFLRVELFVDRLYPLPLV